MYGYVKSVDYHEKTYLDVDFVGKKRNTRGNIRFRRNLRKTAVTELQI